MAEHPRVLGAERCDPAWEKQNSEDSFNAFTETRRTLTDELRRARRARPLHDRLRRAQETVIRLQAGATVNIGRSSKSAESDTKPPDASTIDVSRHLRVIEARLREMETEIDTYLGLDTDRVRGRMISNDKDKMICSKEFEGMRPEDLSEAYPFLGSPRTIRRVRSDGGLRGVDGTPKPPELDRRLRAA